MKSLYIEISKKLVDKNHNIWLGDTESQIGFVLNCILTDKIWAEIYIKIIDNLNDQLRNELRKNINI